MDIGIIVDVLVMNFLFARLRCETLFIGDMVDIHGFHNKKKTSPVLKLISDEF